MLPWDPPAASPYCRQSFIQLSYGLVIKETKFHSVAFSSSQERHLQYPAMLLQQTKSKSSPRRLPCRSHHNGHHNHDTKFDVTDTRVNLELLFHTTEDIPWKKFMEMGLVEGEAPTRVIASFFQTSRELWCWHSKYQQPSLKGKAQNDIPRLIPSLLRVISANYFFFPQQFLWDHDKKVTTVCQK